MVNNIYYLNTLLKLISLLTENGFSERNSAMKLLDEKFIVGTKKIN